MTQRPPWLPEGIDLARPSVARMYDYYLGGYHNLPADRELAEAAMAASPDVLAVARAGRSFLARSVTHLAADLGVRQFLDLGSGIPTQGNVHDIVQAIDPSARVVYVDLDPVAVAHSEAILAGNPNAVAAQGDLRRPDEVLALPAVTDLLDLDQPVALLMMLVLHFIGDADGPAGLLRRYRAALGPASWLALSHGTAEFASPEVTENLTALYSRSTAPVTMRTHAQIMEILDGYHLVPPGLVLLERWRPGVAADVPGAERFPGWAGVARAS